MEPQDFDYEKYPRKLNLGCGFDIKEGYLNVDLNDFHGPDLVADISDLKELPSGYYEKIIAYDVLEHIKRNQTKIVLSEWNRLLKVGGIMRLQVPSLLGLLSLFQIKEYQSVAKQEELIHCLFGSQQYNGDFHYTGFTELILTNYLSETGFKAVSILVKDEWLFVAVAKKIKECMLRQLLDIKDNKDFLEESYRSILERMPDESGLSYYMDKLENGEVNRRSVLGALLDSDERKNLSNRIDSEKTAGSCSVRTGKREGPWEYNRL